MRRNLLQYHPIRLGVIVLALIGLFFNASAQEENVWTFGRNAGIDFNGTVPVAFTSNIGINDIAGRANASVCDSNGKLLFYTEGTRVLNSQHVPMPNGNNLVPLTSIRPVTTTTEVAQGTIIVPFPGSENNGKYYIFSLASDNDNAYSNNVTNETKGAYALYYSVVDMNMNNGQGVVVIGQKGILVDSNLSQRMSAVVGNTCSIWLLTTTRGPAPIVLKAYEITSSGINPAPVSSNIFYDGNRHGRGQIAVSLPRNKMAVTSWNVSANFLSGLPDLVLYDFDVNTGVVSNGQIISSTLDYGKKHMAGAYSACFSPDGSKLYYIMNAYLEGWSLPSHCIFQIDLNAGSLTDIIDSRTYIDQTALIDADLKLGPDGKIYYVKYGARNAPPVMHTINYPNEKGLSCQPSFSGFDLTANSRVSQHGGLPNVVPVFPRLNMSDTALCLGDSILLPRKSFRIEAISGDLNSVLCFDCDTIVLKPQVASSYTLYSGCDQKTFAVQVYDYPEFDLGNDTFVCNLPFFELKVDSAQIFNFQWQDGSKLASFHVIESGAYWVKVAHGDICASSDTVQVFFSNLLQDLGADRLLCRSEPLALGLSAHAAEEAEIKWSTGEIQKEIQVAEFGKYWVTVSDSLCSGSDTINIKGEYCECVFNIPNAFSPNGDGLNDDFSPVIESGCPVKNYMLNIYNRYGRLIFTSSAFSTAWNGSYGNKPADVGTYFYEVSFEGGSRGKLHHYKGDVILVR